jgi:D-mannonate dehydratase
MINREQIDELFRYLLAGVATPRDDRQAKIDQSRQLLSAFSRIDDAELRQELVVLMEIVSQMPEVLQRKRDSWGKAKIAQFH